MQSCQRFNDISVSEKILNTFFLLSIALGYLFSLGQIYFSHQGRDGQPGLSIEDVAIAYHGSPDQTRLAAAIKGPMAGNLKNPADREVILKWIDAGAQHEIYRLQVAPILQRDCAGCHSPASGLNVPPLTGYEQVVKLTEADRGASMPSLVRVSHIHLFGIAFILFFVGKLFILCDIPVWLKRLTIGLPFLSMLIDILAWYLTRETPGFAYLLVFSGAVMGLSLNFQIWFSLLQMWFPESSKQIAEKLAAQAVDFMGYASECTKRQALALASKCADEWGTKFDKAVLLRSSRDLFAFLDRCIRRMTS